MPAPLFVADRLQGLIDALPRDQLGFAPVPVKPRHDGWTAARQRGFIDRLALCGCIRSAAAGVGMSRKSAYRLRARPGAAAFAAAWDQALGWGEARVTDIAIERALCGEVRRALYQGRQIDERLVHDNRLLIALLTRAVARRVPPPLKT